MRVKFRNDFYAGDAYYEKGVHENVPDDLMLPSSAIDLDKPEAPAKKRGRPAKVESEE